METQESRHTKTLSLIADAIRKFVDGSWPDMKCTSCGTGRPFVVTHVSVDFESQPFEITAKPWKVSGLQKLPAPGWVELSIDGDQMGSCTRATYCPKCAQARFR